MSRELDSAISEFYSVGKDKRENVFAGNPHEIGGRAVDVENLAFSVEHAVREYFPINEVPPEMVSALRDLRMHARQFETTLAEILRFLIADAKKRGNA